MSIRAFALCLTTALSAASTSADLITLEPKHDNTLYEDPQGLLANGSGQYLFAGLTATGAKRRALLSFDLSDIPQGSSINSVELSLYMSRTITSPLPMTVHRVTSPWGEGPTDAPGEEGGGAPVLPGDATWTHSLYDDTAWQSPGGDFINLPSATRIVGNVGYYRWSSQGLISDIQDWISNPAANHGWLLRGFEETGIDTTAKRFDSRENPDPTHRPTLVIDYTPVPAPGSLLISVVALAALCRGRPWRASG